MVGEINFIEINGKKYYPKEKETTHKGLNGVPIILHGYFDQDGGFVVEKTERINDVSKQKQ